MGHTLQQHVTEPTLRHYRCLLDITRRVPIFPTGVVLAEDPIAIHDVVGVDRVENVDLRASKTGRRILA